MKKNGITEYFVDVETESRHEGYFYSVAEAITIVILGSLCGLRNIRQIHLWAASERVKGFLKEEFGIKRIPCYYWLLCLLKTVKPQSLSELFTKWVKSLLSHDMTGTTLALDGKTIRSTGKMKDYEESLHIVSAQVAEFGLTLATKSVEGKSNEIPAVQDLLNSLEISGCMVVADALNCQEKTAKIIVKKNADYLLSVKGNQAKTEEEIEGYVKDKEFRDNMERVTIQEKNRNRDEKRTAYVSYDLSYIQNKEKWAKLACFGAIHTEVKFGDGKVTNEWHYYISSQRLTGEQLLHYARKEWSVETMHWLLDVHFGEDFCRIRDKNAQQNLNILRKFALNLVKNYKTTNAPKRPMSHIMFNCLMDCYSLMKLIS